MIAKLGGQMIAALLAGFGNNIVKRVIPQIETIISRETELQQRADELKYKNKQKESNTSAETNRIKHELVQTQAKIVGLNFLRKLQLNER